MNFTSVLSSLDPSFFKDSVTILLRLHCPPDPTSYPYLPFNFQGHGLRRLRCPSPLYLQAGLCPHFLPPRSSVFTDPIAQTSSDAWFKPTEENIHSGVCLRVDQGRFRVFPYENPYLQPFERAIRILNPVAAVKVRSAAIHAALAHACVYPSGFLLNLANAPLNPARRMPNQYLSLKTLKFRLSIR